MTADVEQAMTGPVEQLLSEPGRWTQGVTARNSQGIQVGAISRDAVCWCLIGAVTHAYHDGDQMRMLRRMLAAVLAEMRQARLSSSERDMIPIIAEWNDAPERTHADILRVVRKAGI